MPSIAHTVNSVAALPGIMGVGSGPDGSNAHLLPNHYGPFLLTRLLLPLMASHGRIVTVGSESHRRLQPPSGNPNAAVRDLERSSNFWCEWPLQHCRICPPGSHWASYHLALAAQSPSSFSFWIWNALPVLLEQMPHKGISVFVPLEVNMHVFVLVATNTDADYAKSKLANLLMTAELSRRLRARGSTVTAYCVSPGRVRTNIFANVPGLLRRPIELVAGLFFQTPKQVCNWRWGTGGCEACYS